MYHVLTDRQTDGLITLCSKEASFFGADFASRHDTNKAEDCSALVGARGGSLSVFCLCI